MSLAPGEHVTESLRLVRLLGRGAMGSVWLADHLALESQVAVKFMAQTQLDDPVAVKRFRQEARAAAEIRSPHVVQVFDHGFTSDGTPFIVMELLEGESLDRRIKRIGPLSPWEMAMVLAQSCKALAKAHERGILHRDIKPPNIFLIEAGGEPFVKVLDFGVAKFSGEEALQMTAAGHMVGTPAYMSPEQLFDGHEVDHRGDLWSLAVVAYWALTGLRPFEGATLGELCVSIKRGEFARPSTLRNDLSPEVDRFFARAFHRDLGARFSNAKEMAQAFENAVGASGSTLRSGPSGVSAPQLMTYGGTAVSSRPSPRRRTRRWALWAGAAVLVSIGIGGAALLVTQSAPEPAPAAPTPTADPVPPAVVLPEPAAPAESSAPTDSVAGAAPAPSARGAPPPSARAAPPRAGSAAAPLLPPPGAAPAPPQPPAPEADEREEKAAKTLGI